MKFICLSGQSKFDMDWNLFLQNCFFYIKLLIIMLIRMFDVQYWKSNNICNTWKVKKWKTKNLNVVYLLEHINGLCKFNFSSKLCEKFLQSWWTGGCMPWKLKYYILRNRNYLPECFPNVFACEKNSCPAQLWLFHIICGSSAEPSFTAIVSACVNLALIFSIN